MFACAVTLCAVSVCLVFVAGASAAVPWWQLDALSMPANLAPDGTGTLALSASDLGEGEINGSSTPVKLRDVLPAGLVATSAVANSASSAFGSRIMNCEVISGSLVECTFEGTLEPYERLEVEVG